MPGRDSRHRAELQNVEVRLEIAEPVPALDADSGQLRQVIYNLMFNALDVLPQGGVIHVWAGLEASDMRSDSQVVIRVEDSGPGLPPGIQDQIFEPFISSKDAGLGLGLSISRRIVEAHGGTIAARTAAGAARSSPCISLRRRRASRGVPNNWRDQRTRTMPKLLIVDDEPGILYSLRASLETDQTTVLTAPTAKLGLAAVAREKPDAVLLDLRLPDMSGLDAFDRIREKDHDFRSSS